MLVKLLTELLSNFYGAIEVDNMIKASTAQKEALNTFMKRVVGSIDK